MIRRALPLLVIPMVAAILAGCDLTNPSGGDSSVSASASGASDSATASEPASAEASSDSATASASFSSTSDVGDNIPRTDFPHNPATQLVSGSGQGYTDTSNWAPGICFPIAQTPDYADSQVYSPGGDHYPNTTHPTGSQCDASNYAYPWRDNFCETRPQWNNPMCSAGTGHQGQDIRPTTCKANMYWAVAAEDGVITQVGSYTVALTGNDSPHRIFRYLHMQVASLKVKLGDHVARGQKLGLVSDNFGTLNGVQQHTTVHLHFEVRVAQAETAPDGTKLAANAFVPPYTALVDAYQRKLAGDCPTVE